MLAARSLFFAGCLSLALAVSTAAAAAPEAAPAGGAAPDGAAPEGEAAGESQSGYGHLKPLLMDPDRVGGSGRRLAGPGDRPSDAGDRPSVRVDPKARTVRVPVRVTHARGVVEWVLSAGGRHARMSVLLTRCPVRTVARALEQTGLAEGRPPTLVGEDAARPPRGPAVRLTVRFRQPDGSWATLPAEALLAAASAGTPLPPGRWVYVGPQTLADGKVLLAELSGSLVTTGLQDRSAMIYWVPASSGEEVLYVQAYYGRVEAVPGEVTEAVLEIRPAAASPEPGP